MERTFYNVSNSLFLLLLCCCGSGGGGGVFLACEDLGGRFDDAFPACAFFVCFVLKWRLACAHKSLDM